MCPILPVPPGSNFKARERYFFRYDHIALLLQHVGLDKGFSLVKGDKKAVG